LLLFSQVSFGAMFGREETTFDAGTLAGAGTFHCEECGFAVALHERDEVPACPHCGGTEFKRSSIFGELNVVQEPMPDQDETEPDWLAEARESIDRDGDYVAFDQDGSLRVISLAEGWTRVGRSLSAHIRFDDPTVSRRHALVHRDRGGVRLLDDRSLNGVFVNGDRIEMRQLEDGDRITIGRFELYFMSLTGTASRGHDRAPGAFA
jgi:predicted RNA-binding Zn-ribbon protein involved in translation (DUF1610 family)